VTTLHLQPSPQLPLFDLNGRTVLVLGLGQSGLAMARWAAFRGASVRVADTRQAPENLQLLEQELPGVPFVAASLGPELLEGVDLIAWSPGLSIEIGPTADFHAMAVARGIAVAGEIELFAQALALLREQGYAPAVIAITGTNGKTTTTALTAHLCRSAGRSTRAAGNIGPAALDALREAVATDDLPEIWVLELSSFQLALAQSLRPQAATILNLTQDHLDWHASTQSYGQAKQRIYAPGTVAVWNRDDPATQPQRDTEQVSFGLDAPQQAGDLGLLSEGALEWLAEAVATDDPVGNPRRRKQPVEVSVRRLMPAEALRIAGRHNHANALAALALARAIGVPLARMLHALRDFTGEPHRCQHVACIEGVDYFDDSKGTNVGATVAALQGLGRPVVLIAGGDGKGQDFSPLAPPVAWHARAVVLIGRDGPLLGQALHSTGVNIEASDSLEQAVAAARMLAKPGDAVLLSPACASFDMFRNYEHRAQVFVDAVRQIALESGVPC
jgi:UDP-N-acetylmuramoylalanine--D-glutamate ligase